MFITWFVLVLGGTVECGLNTADTTIEATLAADGRVELTKHATEACTITGTLNVAPGEQLTMAPTVSAQFLAVPGLVVQGKANDIIATCETAGTCVRVDGGTLRDAEITTTSGDTGLEIVGNYCLVEKVRVDGFDKGVNLGKVTPALLCSVRDLRVRTNSAATSGFDVSANSNSNVLSNIVVNGGFTTMVSMDGSNNIWVGGDIESTSAGVSEALTIKGSGAHFIAIRLEFGGSAEAGLTRLVHFTSTANYNLIDHPYIAMSRNDFGLLVKDDGFHNRLTSPAGGTTNTKLPSSKLDDSLNIFQGSDFSHIQSENGLPATCTTKTAGLSVNRLVTSSGRQIYQLELVAPATAQLTCTLPHKALEGKNFDFGAWVYSTTAMGEGVLRVWLTDDQQQAVFFVSSGHGGTGWEYLHGRGKAPVTLTDALFHFRPLTAGTFKFRNPVVAPQDNGF